jgi:hypothetical protein
MLLNLLENDLASAGSVPYDSNILFIRMIDEIEPQLLLVLDAVARPTQGKPQPSGIGSPITSVRNKFSPQFKGDLEDALKQLGRLGLVQDNVVWGITGTAEGTHQTSGLLTSIGSGLISLIRSPLPE